MILKHKQTFYRSSPADVFLAKGVLEICNKLSGEHSCRSAILIKLHGIGALL